MNRSATASGPALSTRCTRVHRKATGSSFALWLTNGSASSFAAGRSAPLTTNFEQRFCAFKAFATRTEGGQEPGAINCAAARQSGKERGIGVLGEGAGDLASEPGDSSMDGAQPECERL